MKFSNRIISLFEPTMIVFLLSLAASSCLGFPRDMPKPKAVGSLSHSIVNLGKMDINVYLDKNHNRKALEELFQPVYHGDSQGHESPKSQYEIVHPSRPSFMRPEAVIEECPCSRTRSGSGPSAMSSGPSPTDIISRILTNNDLFSSFNDPTSSALCCTSHEQVQEEFIIEFGPKPAPVLSQHRSPQPRAYFTQPQQIPPLLPKAFPYLPFLTDSFQNKAANPKSKQIEILLFPTKKGIGKNDLKSKSALRSDIQVVGDKQTTMLYDIASTKTSVKKDLTQEKVNAAIVAGTPKVNGSANIPNNAPSSLLNAV